MRLDLNSLRTITVSMALLTTAQIAHAQDKVILLTAPSGWNKAYEHEQNGVSIEEYVKQGESIKKWSEMITLIRTPHHGVGPMKNLLNAGLNSIISRCQEKSAKAMGRYWQRNGQNIGMVAEVACDDINTTNTPPDVDSRSKELLRLFVADSPHGVYNIQMAWHHNELSARAMFENKEQRAAFDTLIKTAINQYQ